VNDGPKLDLSLKQGQTLTISIGQNTPAAAAASKKEMKQEEASLDAFVLPPPPKARVPAVNHSTNASSSSNANKQGWVKFD
jgi:hypothetical protein